MSIISKALKKTQKTRDIKEPSTSYFFPKNISLKKPFGLKKFADNWKRSRYIRKSIFTSFSVLITIGILAFFVSRVIHVRETPPLSEKIKEKTVINEIFPMVTGIMFSQTSPHAVIDGTLVSEGSSVTGFLVVKIFPDKVKLTRNNEDFILSLQ